MFEDFESFDIGVLEFWNKFVEKYFGTGEKNAGKKMTLATENLRFRRFLWKTGQTFEKNLR